MKKLLIPILYLSISVSLYAQEGSKKGEIDLSGINELYVMIDAGMEITLTGTNSQSLNYEYEFDGNAEAYSHFFENFAPELEQNGSQSRLVIDFPKQSGQRVNHRIKKHSINITLPRELILELETRYSKVSASDFTRGVDIKNRSGLVQIRNSKQLVSVKNEYGDVVITDVEGELTISNRSAKVDVKNITGNVTMSTQYSKMNISNIRGTVDISNRSGTLNAFDITGDMKLSGSYMEYELTDISGAIDMSNKSGKVTLDSSHSFAMSGEYTHVNAVNITGERGVEISGKSATITLTNVTENVSIDGQYLKISLKDIDGEAQIYNKSAEVRIDGLGENLLIEGEYMPVNVKNFKGSTLEIINRSNDITVEAINELDLVMIDSQYGDVTLHLKKKYSGSINVETRYGKFTSSLVIDSQQLTKSNNELVLSGTVGSGNGQMVIKTRSADIRVDQQ
ncbi:MAG: DUF4097 family beta strand repeat protein [Balneolaceae bacterium]|nr:DUF4097 family beta strand repeat protein [Balneolaceae bacterium]MBO6547739.1 DUF4097 family beta strand repeat protein [Balneolaceae bacterium]MBO6648250.1 DUF4097 family beta strand repeat protein [Balneolaceae bacterium]